MLSSIFNGNISELPYTSAATATIFRLFFFVLSWSLCQFCNSLLFYFFMVKIYKNNEKTSFNKVESWKHKLVLIPLGRTDEQKSTEKKLKRCKVMKNIVDLMNAKRNTCILNSVQISHGIFSNQLAIWEWRWTLIVCVLRNLQSFWINLLLQFSRMQCTVNLYTNKPRILDYYKKIYSLRFFMVSFDVNEGGGCYIKFK